MIRFPGLGPSLAATLALALALAACQQEPVIVPVRTFERAQKVDFVCMRVLDADPNDASRLVAVVPRPVPRAQCSPVPTGVDGAGLPFHLYGVVTQTSRGEVAVVDLTAGKVVDEDRVTPGINFVPVGALPADVASSPDGAMVFVASAEVNRPAIYGIPGHRLLGDSQGLPAGDSPPSTRLTEWPACALPAVPSSLLVVPRKVDLAAPPEAVTYDLTLVLPGDGVNAPRVVQVDPQPFLVGAGLAGGSAETAVAPGSLTPCPLRGEGLALDGTMPAGFVAGQPWGDGLSYAAGFTPADKPSAGGGACRPESVAGAGPAVPPGTTHLFALGPLGVPRAGAVARADTVLYVADAELPLIHVVDLSNPSAPKELAPLQATSLSEPDRRVSVGALSVSPVTRSLQRFLYAVDQGTGTLMVYDVTDPVTSPKEPLTRPHPEYNPFQPIDRIGFGSPVAAVAFTPHDFPLERRGQGPQAAPTGVLCNPNPALKGTGDVGAAYRGDDPTIVSGLGPIRLRGVFAFVTLSSGEVLALDVDDWDAPCRRPDPMGTFFPASALAAPQTASANDPYGAPFATSPGDLSSPVSQEAFFPVSAPHRVRSVYLLRRETNTGAHIPSLVGQPQLFDGNASLPTSGPDAVKNPVLLPTRTVFDDPTYVKGALPADPRTVEYLFPGVPGPGGFVTHPVNDEAIVVPGKAQTAGLRFAWEDPMVHLDQDWIVAYESKLPGFEGFIGTMTPDRDASTGITDQTLTLFNRSAFFCRRGIEDARLGRQRALAALSEYRGQSVLSEPPRLERRVGDYVSVRDGVLPEDSGYWSEEPEMCWGPDALNIQSPASRREYCQQTFGNSDSGSLERDFPILEAYEDRLILGRFGRPAAAPTLTTNNREIVGKHPSNVPFLRTLRCCFHGQASFDVRAAGQWIAIGSASGYMHHVKADPLQGGACVQSCDPRDALRNARALEVPRPPAGVSVEVMPERTSALAFRNPMFAFVAWAGAAPTAPDVTTTKRDYVFRFTTRGQVQPLSIVLAKDTTAVSPQSMRFVDSLQQLAIVDGASLGLILIDLNTVTTSRTYF